MAIRPKMNGPKLKWKTALVGLVIAGFAISSHAAIVVSSGETVLFSDNFEDNSNGWDPVSVVDGVGTPVTGTASIGTSDEWSPAIIGDVGSIKTSKTFGTELNVMDGPISLYMRVRKDNLAGAQFSIALKESTGTRFFSLYMQDGVKGQLSSRNDAGGGQYIDITKTTFPDTTTYFDYKVTLTPGATLSDLGTTEGFVYNTTTSSYDSLGTSTGVDILTGLYDNLEIYTRNATDRGVHFDEVIVTQSIPEPSTLLMMGLFGFALAGINHRRKRG